MVCPLLFVAAFFFFGGFGGLGFTSSTSSLELVVALEAEKARREKAGAEEEAEKVTAEATAGAMEEAKKNLDAAAMTLMHLMDDCKTGGSLFRSDSLRVAFAVIFKKC